MKALITAVMLSLTASSVVPLLAHAADSSCTATIGDKKLVGAAKASFMKKCETDARAKCNAVATDKKLAGAAKVSFTKKCLSDAVGS